MNVDMNEIYTNLVPFPRLHFLITALNIRQNNNNNSNNLVVTNPSGRDRGGGLESGNKIALQRAFADILSTRGQITAALPTCGVISNNSSSNNNNSITLASAFLARGKVPLSDFIRCVTDASHRSLRFPVWNTDACKVLTTVVVII